MFCGNESTSIAHIDDPASADQVAEWDRIDGITGFEIMHRSIDMGAGMGTHDAGH